MSTNLAFGDQLKELMAQRGFTQSALSRRSGVERTVINRMISGKAKPRPEQIDWMAQALGVDMCELLKHADPPDGVRTLAAQLAEARARIAELEREREDSRGEVAQLQRALRSVTHVSGGK